MSDQVAVGLAMRVRYDLQAEVARTADDLGYDALWFPEHLVWPITHGGLSPYDDGHPPVDPTIPTLDALMWMATLAQVTTRIRLGTYVYNLALRSPHVAARAVQTLDVISGGRVDFGVGAGWNRGEYEAVGVDFTTRGKRFNEAIAVLRTLWTEKEPSFHGDFYDFSEVAFEPKPPQGSVPILIGGTSPAALKRAGTLGDGWIGMDDSIESTQSRSQEILSYGRDVQIIVGGSDVHTVDDLRRWSEAGADRIIVSPWRKSAEALDGIKRFAETVLEPARAEGLLAS